MPAGVCNVQVKIPQHMQNLTALKTVGAEGCSFPDFMGLTSNTQKGNGEPMYHTLGMGTEGPGMHSLN